MIPNIHDYLSKTETTWLQLLKDLVSIDSSKAGDPKGVNQVLNHVATYLKKIGISSEQSSTPVGNILTAKVGISGPKILCLGHVDTVLPPEGNLLWHEAPAEDRIYGSGAMDMKGGDVYMVAIAETVKQFNLPVQLTLMLVPDEETGSHHSKAAIETAAKNHDYCIVFEASETMNDIVRSRKTGIHSEYFFQKIDQPFYLKLAQFLTQVVDLIDLAAGKTINPILSLKSATPPRSNVVPDQASLELKFSYPQLHEFNMFCDKLYDTLKKATLPGAKFSLRLIDEQETFSVYRYTVIGKKAHAGNNIEDGINAWVELGHRLQALESLLKKHPLFKLEFLLTPDTRHLTPDLRLQFDMRSNTLSDLDQLQAAAAALLASTGVAAYLSKPFKPDTPSRPAMEPSAQLDAAITKTFTDAGLTVNLVHKGGMSDGNITRGVGCPTTDAWGPIGADLHTYREHIVRSQFLPKLKLAVELVLAVKN